MRIIKIRDRRHAIRLWTRVFLSSTVTITIAEIKKNQNIKIQKVKVENSETAK